MHMALVLAGRRPVSSQLRLVFGTGLADWSFKEAAGGLLRATGPADWAKRPVAGCLRRSLSDERNKKSAGMDESESAARERSCVV